MVLDSQSLPPLKSALFVDFDNIYIGLGKNDPAAAERFAADPTRWLSWLEEGLPLRGENQDGPARRRSILVRRCYPNPDAGFRRYRSFFTSAAFSVIDCPTLTRTGKNSSDIYMVMDILDILDHKTHFDEFIIFSGDSDFMPVLLRLRAHDRRTTTLAIDFMPPAFKAACDMVINEEDFIEDALGLSQDTAGRVKVSLPVLKEMAQRVLDIIRQNGEVSGADLPDILKDFREFRDSTNWLGYGTSHRLAEALIGQEQRLELVRVNSIQYKLALALKPVSAAVALPHMHLSSVVSKGHPANARALGQASRGEVFAGSDSAARPDRDSRPTPGAGVDPVARVESAFQKERGGQVEAAVKEDAGERAEKDDQSEPAVRLPGEGETSAENEALKQQVVAAVREVVTGSRGPVAGEDALDQFFCRHPDEFLGRPVERAILDHESEEIHLAHLAAAAYELPLTPEDEDVFGPRWEEAARRLVKQGRLRERGGRYLPRGPGYPAAEIALRSASPDSVAIVEAQDGELIGTVESARAHSAVHTGAVYLHMGSAFEVEDLDLAARRAVVRPFEGDWYTQPKRESETWIESVRDQRDACGVILSYGIVSVTEQVVAYQKKRVADHSVLDLLALDMPEQQFVTQALWYELPDELLREEFPLEVLQGSLHAAEHGQIAVLPLIAMCDRWDIGGLSTAFHRQTGRATIFIYDGHPGGVGITRVGFERFEQLVDDALRLISECPCRDGCPSCVQSPKCGNLNEPLNKRGAIEMLGRMASR